VGGQAVIEGVMMRRGDRWSLATREPDGSIHTETHDVAPFGPAALKRIPLLRGVVALADSLRLGYRALIASATRQLPEDRPSSQPLVVVVIAATALFGALFIALPLAAATLLHAWMPTVPLELFEGVFRVALFLSYVAAIGRMAHIGRVFEYHGAEHQSIACVEAGEPLTPTNAGRFSVRHPRCGTAFLLWVLTIAVAVYAIVPADSFAEMVAVRVFGLPLIAGISYEVIRATARYDNRLMAALRTPGLWMQRLTTRTPDDAQREVAIAAVRALDDVPVTA
jgi:uncharacterized protein YqhQ